MSGRIDWLTPGHAQMPDAACLFRHAGGSARTGYWCMWVDLPRGAFVRVDCVMDDFGYLVPVSCRPSYRIEVLQ